MKITSSVWAAPLVLVTGLAACFGAAPKVASTVATSPPTPAPPRSPFGPLAVDATLRAEWAKSGVTAAPRVDDATFLRRAYLDVVGTVPSPAAVAEFASDRSPDKRARLVDRLLVSPAYASYWATYWEATLVGWNTKSPLVDRRALREWLEAEFAMNAPWDEIVTALVTATGQNTAGGRRVDGAPLPMPQSELPQSDVAASGSINGAVNWFLRYKDAPQDIAGTASRLFLGVQIQCAQCHDHKTEKWKQADFQRFAACFARTRTEPLDPPKAMGLKRAVVVDIGRPLPRFARNADLTPITEASPATLDGTDLRASPDVRGALAAWMTAKDNPWFAKAIVNRMWGHFLGRGFVDPIDDIRESNPATMPDLFARMSDDFVQHGDDLKALIRLITSTEAYQLAPAPAVAAPSTPPERAADAERLWSRFHITPLGPNELLRSILDVTGVESVLAARSANLDRIRFQLYQRYAFLFDVDEDFEQTDFEGTVSQALTLLNGELVGGGTSGVPGGVLDAVLRQPGDDSDKVTALYVRALARAPGTDELAYWVRYVNEPHTVDLPGEAPLSPAKPPIRGKKKGKARSDRTPDALTRLEARDLVLHPDSRRQAYADLFWALLNSSEFTFNH